MLIVFKQEVRRWTHQWAPETKIFFVDAPESAIPLGNSVASVTSRLQLPHNITFQHLSCYVKHHYDDMTYVLWGLLKRLWNSSS